MTLTGIVQLRPLTPADAKMIFDWRNDATIVRLSSSQKSVVWEEHEKWITQSIGNPDRQVYIININDEGIGQVRFDKLAVGKAAISAYLLSEYTGKGFGVTAIDAGVRTIFEEWPDLDEILAFVRTDNLPSQKAFKKSGFVPGDSDANQQEGHLTFVNKRNVN